MFRADPGIGFEMMRAIEQERDLYTLFSVALEQNTAMDIRRAAANRINIFGGNEIFDFIRKEAEPKILEGIVHSSLFPTTFKTIAKAAKEGKTAEDLLLAALMEQNRLLKAAERRKQT